VWRLGTGEAGNSPTDREPTVADIEIDRATHRLIARVTDEYDRWSYNTAVAGFMEFTNELYKYVQSDEGPRTATLSFAIDTMLLLLAPMTPHITAELWSRRRVAPGDQSAAALAHIHEESWPIADPAKLTVDTVTMVVQVNGKVRDKFEVDAGIADADAEARALTSDKVVAALAGAEPKKVIVRAPKLVNIVV
jgi:leucyl-tRNA synthetase